VSSVGFWPGSGDVKEAASYSYAAPLPEGFKDAVARPSSAYFDAQLGEFLLTYEAVRTEPSPTGTLFDFCQSTYEAASRLGKWDVQQLER